jgi:flagellar motor protein MotB
MTGRTRGLLLGLVLGTCAAPMLAYGGDRSLIAQLDDEIIALRQRVFLLEKHCGSDQAPPSIYAELVQVFAGTPVTVARQGTRASVTLSADELYSTDSLTLREEAQPWLDLLSTALSVNPETNLVIVGHTDGTPAPTLLRTRYPTAWEWGMAEATVVGEQLIRHYAIQPGRITIGSRGPWDPLASNDTPEGRAINRRVVIHLSEGKYP